MDNISVRVNHPSPKRQDMDHLSTAPKDSKKPKKNKVKVAVLAAVAILLLCAAIFGGWFALHRTSMPASIDSKKYQAVFFTNGQVYFGKLQTLRGGYFKLNDIYYLQAPASTEAKTEDASSNPQETTAQQSSDVQLIKLGNEVHGPDDEMIISKDQILFFENLKSEGKVTDSIAKYQSQKK